MALGAAATTAEEEEERLCFEILEHFPCMVFAKDGNAAARGDYDRGFRYVYFNAAMDHASGFSRGAMIGRNAKDHFPVHFERYFADDRAVMALPPAPVGHEAAATAAATATAPQGEDADAAVMDIYEPWKVATGDHVNHTRKVNLAGRYMLGTFLVCDEVHLGRCLERRRRVPPPKSAPPPSPCPYFFTNAFEALPVPVLVLIRDSHGGGGIVAARRNAAYRMAFASGAAEVDSHLAVLDGIAVPGVLTEMSGVAFVGRRWHLLQRPVVTAVEEQGQGGDSSSKSSRIRFVINVLWREADEGRYEEARRALGGVGGDAGKP